MTNDIASTCPARHTCRKRAEHGESVCSSSCAWYIELRYQLALSDIPEEYRLLTAETLPGDWEHADDLRHFAAVAAERKPKNGLYLTSATTGNGKTASACAVGMSYIIARTRKALAEGRDNGQLVQFVNVVDLLDRIKAGYSDDDERAKADALMRRIAKAEMVVFDDFASHKPSPWAEERFYAMLDAIWTNRHRQTIICTSNVNLEQVEILMGPRIRSRIDGMTLVLPFRGNDRRRKQYKTKEDDKA